ncbi:MAG: hypothetical protein AAB839_02670, partial [Patescibacteria group bacterium]
MDFMRTTSPGHRRSIDEILDGAFTIEHRASAQKFFDGAAQSISRLARLRTTPQTPPKHTEGPWVSDHVLRMLTVIDAIANGFSVQESEEAGSDPIITLALHDAENAARESPALFRAYALIHDIAKPDRLLLVANPGSAGEKEGFVRSGRRANEYSTESEVIRFDKMRRAGLAEGIEATFDDADRAVIAPEYAADREAIVRFCGLEGAYVKFVMELCWSHGDIASFFVLPGNESAFLAFP